MSATEQDRAEARALWGHCLDHEGDEGSIEMIAEALTEARVDELRDTIAEIAYQFEGHIPDLTNVNLGAILARLGARADRLEAS